MGRRRADDGADQLPAMVRRKNAVNEELTLAARSEDVWAAVESGKERRRRLACEREYGVGGPGAKPAAVATVAAPAKTPPADAKVGVPAAEKNKVAPTAMEPRPAASIKRPDQTKQTAPAKAAIPVESSATAKKGKTSKEASKPASLRENNASSGAQKPEENLAISKKPMEKNAGIEVAKAVVTKPTAQEGNATGTQNQEEAKPKTENPPDVVASSEKPTDLAHTAQKDEAQEVAQQDNKKSKRGKRKGGRPSESNDQPAHEPETSACAPAAPLAINLAQMVSDERSPVTGALLPSPPESLPTPSTSLPTPSMALPTPSVPISTPLSYAEKAKHPPASPPSEEPPLPPPRDDSPEPQYDPIPRAHSPPPAPALAPCSPVTEEWMPVETRKEKRRRRRSERASESEHKSESERKSESAAEPDAFDLLLSGGEGLHDGLQEALEEEEPPAPPVSTAAPADAFDLLLSADDLGDGFQEAFGDEEEEVEPAKKKEEVKYAKTLEKAKPAKKQKETKPTENKEETKPAKEKKSAAPALDAFDLMMGDNEGLHEGFEQAFIDDEVEEPPKSSSGSKTRGREKTGADKPAKGNKREHKTSHSDKNSSPSVTENRQKDESEKKSDKPQSVTLEKPTAPQEQTTQELNKPPGKSKKPRSRKNSERTKETGRTQRKSTSSESEQIASPTDASGVPWFDKFAHDAAEAQFYEDTTASQPAVSEEAPAPQQQVAQLQTTSQEPDKPQGKGKKPRSRKNSEKTKQGRTPRVSTCSESEPAALASDTATWFDKAVYDAAEAQFYEGMYTGGGQTDNQQEVLKKTSATPALQPLSRSTRQCAVEASSRSSPLRSKAAATPVVPPSSASLLSPSPEDVACSALPQHPTPPNQATSPRPAPSTAVPEAGVPIPDPRSPPMSLSSQPEQYFEDVVLAGRQSAATMVALPGFTAAPLSERLAPGEQLDSLRTEPELEPDEPAEPGDAQRAGKKRPRRRRRRSDRTSESERKSESEPAQVSRPEAVAETPAAQPPASQAGKKNGEEKRSSKAMSTNSTENGTVEKSHSKTSKSRHQRRKKTKSTSSTGEPPENDVATKETLTTPRTNNNNVSYKPTVAPTPEATSPAPAAVSPAAEAKTPSKSDSPATPAGSDSQPSSPEHVITSSPEHEGPRFVPNDGGRRYASLLQQEADMLPARPVFLAHACFVCKQLHSKQSRLKSCGSCRLVAYCSATHQRAHWPLHRALCKVITKRMRKLGTDHLYREALSVTSHEQWKQIRFKHMTVCEEMLGRAMEAYEKEMFLYPRACETCHETTPEKLHTCHSCHSVSYCSEEHLRPTHAKFCKDLRLLVDIHTYQNQHGVCDPLLPDKMLTTYEHLPPNIREFLVVSMLGPVKAYGMGNIELAVLSEQASYPLTLLYALQNIPVPEEAHISQLTELTVHVVGAEFSAECDNVTKWDVFLLNVLPRLRRLHVVFIGPELEIASSRPGVTGEDFTCESCRRAGKRFTCEFQPSTYYHTYCRSPQFRPPQAICAFNAGIYRTTGHERRDSWLETIPYLVREGVPLVLTAYTLLECPQDVARIQQEQKVDVLLPPMKNPYRSTRPAQNFLNEHESPLIYKNQYVACLTAARPRK